MGAAVACSDSAQPLGKGDTFTNDTVGQDVYSPAPPQPTDGGGDADAYAAPASPCASCTCSSAKNYCFAGGALKTARTIVPSHILASGFGEPDGAAEANAPPPPACPILAAGSTSNGCIPLPSACEATPTCACVLNALQPMYACYLDCALGMDSLEVYCPNGP
jgi:hypothetical protein